MCNFNETHQARPRTGNGTAPGSRTYRCMPGGADDYVYMAASPRRADMWLALVRAIGGEEVATDPNYSDPDWCVEHGDEVNEMIEAWTMERTKYEVFSHPRQGGCTLRSHYECRRHLRRPSFG